MSKTLCKSGASRRGSAAIEFALWIPILVFLIAAVIDWAHYMTIRTSVARAAMDGARIGTSTYEPATATPGDIVVPKAKARTIVVLGELGLPCVSAPDCVVEVSYCASGVTGDCDCDDGTGTCFPPVDAIRVRVDYAFTPFFGSAGTPGRVTDEFVMAVENQR